MSTGRSGGRAGVTDWAITRDDGNAADHRGVRPALRLGLFGHTLLSAPRTGPVRAATGLCA